MQHEWLTGANIRTAPGHSAMWPFKRKKIDPPVEYVNPQELSFSQLDVTEGFDDDLRLTPEDWLTTIPLNIQVENPESSSLPPVGATDEETYRIADGLSRIRESLDLPDDGVYCPICHVANTQISHLRTPCPKCGRALLKFGWT